MPKEKDPRNGESPEPMPRGGARDTHPHTPGETPVRKGRHPNSLANIAAKTWRPGQSGNPAGRTRTFFEITKIAREMTPAAILKLGEIVNSPKTSNRDRISAIALLPDRGLGKPLSAAEHASLGDIGASGGAMPGGMTVLLVDASRRRDAAYKMELKAELARIEIEEERRRDERADRIAMARAALANGETIPSGMEMLLATLDSEN